jgi:imidazolonepropionase-like amidohydrolase
MKILAKAVTGECYRMKQALLPLLFSLTAGASWALADTPGVVAIKDAHVVTVSGEDLPRATVIMREGLIVEVGASSIPADAWVIDGSGLTVYPGFIDALSTWGILAPGTRGTATPAAPSTAALPAEPRAHGPEDRPQTFSFERAADQVSPADSKLEGARAAGFTSAATYPTKGIFQGLGAMIDLAGERGRDMVIVQPIGQQISFRQGGFGRSGFPASLMGNISYVRQLFLDLDQYEQARQIYAGNPKTGKREYDHALEGLAESPRLLLPAGETQQIDRMLKFAPELKKPFILYGLHEAYDRIDELKQAKAPLLVSLKWPEKPKDEDPSEVSSFRELTMRDKAPSVPGLLARAGIRFAFYSDGLDSAADLKKALKKALDAGLSRADAIRALTLNAAEIYGVADRLGTIEKGKMANLVVMKGDAFDDKTTVEYVFVDGRQFQPSKELPQGPAGGKKPATYNGGMER